MRPVRHSPAPRRGQRCSLKVSFARLVVLLGMVHPLLAQDGAPLLTPVEVQQLSQQAFAAEEDLALEAREELVDLYFTLQDLVEDGSAWREDAFALAVIASHLAKVPEEERTFLESNRELLEIARGAARRFGDQELQANVCRRLALVLREDGELYEARSLLEQAIEEFPQARASRVDLLLSLAELARFRGAFDEAVDLLDRADASLLDHSEGFAPHRIRRCALVGLRAQIYIDLGLTDLAAPLLEEELRGAQELGEPLTWIAAILHRAEWMLDTEQFASLEQELLEFLETTELQPAHRGQVLLRLGVAQSELERRDSGRGQQARATLEDALAVDELWVPDRCLGEVILADLWLDHGHLEQASRLLTASEQHFESWPGEGFLRPPVQEVAQVAAVRARLALAQDRSDRDLRAALTELQSAYRLFLGQWESAATRSGGLGFLRLSRRRYVLSELIRLWLRLEGPQAGAERALEELMRAQACGSLGRDLGVSAGSVASLRKAFLPPDTALLVHLPGPNQSHLFVLDHDHIEHHELPDSTQLREAQDRVLGELTTPPQQGPQSRPSDRLRQDLAQLSGLLLPTTNALSLRTKQRLYLSGFDLLGYVPLECLQLPHRAGPLGLELAVSYLPSLPVGQYLAEQSSPASRTYDLTLFVASTPAESQVELWPHLQPFPWDPRLQQQLLRSYAPEKVQAFTAQNASLDSLRRLALGRSSVLQFVTHGAYLAGSERPAGLLLQPTESHNGFLGCDDAEQLQVSPLVLLSACGAARGPRRPGDEGVAHLGGAFLRAGARAVVLPYADLEYRATLQLMEVFHEHLRRGTAPDLALLHARRAVAQDRPHPFYHGLLHVWGLGHQPLFPFQEAPAATSYTWIYWHAILGLLALAAFRKRRC